MKRLHHWRPRLPALLTPAVSRLHFTQSSYLKIIIISGGWPKWRFFTIAWAEVRIKLLYNSNFFPYVLTLKKEGCTNIIKKRCLYCIKSVILATTKMPEKYKARIISNWLSSNRKIYFDLSELQHILCFLCALFMESLSSSCSVCSQSLAQSRFQFFSKWHSNMLSQVPLCLPMTDTWEADGANGPLYISWIYEENCQEPDWIGLVPHGRKGCSGGVTVTENHFDENDLELVEFPMLLLFFLIFTLPRPWIFPWKNNMNKLNTIVSSSSDIIQFFWVCIFPGTVAFHSFHVLLHIRLVWSYVDMDPHISLMNLIVLEWQPRLVTS